MCVSGKEVLRHFCTPLTFCLIVKHVLQDVDVESLQGFSLKGCAGSKWHFRMLCLTLDAMWRYPLTAGVIPFKRRLLGVAAILGSPGVLFMYRVTLDDAYGK